MVGNFGEFLFQVVVIHIYAGVLHALRKVLWGNVLVGLSAVSLIEGAFLLTEFVLTLVGLVAFVDRHAAFL